jgi:hypothetical protein
MTVASFDHLSGGETEGVHLNDFLDRRLGYIDSPSTFCFSTPLPITIAFSDPRR